MKKRNRPGTAAQHKPINKGVRREDWEKDWTVTAAVQKIICPRGNPRMSDLPPPSPFQIAQLAAALDPELCHSHPSIALQRAATFYVRSILWMSDLQRLPPPESETQTSFDAGWLWGLLDDLVPRSHPEYLRTERATALRLYPKGKQADEVCEFLGLKTQRPVLVAVKEFVAEGKRELNFPEEDIENEVAWFLHERREETDGGQECYWLSLEFLNELKEWRTRRKQQRKRAGGIKSAQTRAEKRREKL
jgi:hypothetical protein